MKKLLFSLLFLSACATENPLKDMRFKTVSSGDYTMASWYKITKPEQPVKIYIEGDGKAVDSKGGPTSDPTPDSLFLRKIAADDTSPNVVYMARPCQYLMGSNCSQKDWTTGRFSPKIIDAMTACVNSWKKKAKADKIILIGYSGGAMIASQIAAKQPKSVQKLITVAGILDKDKWSEYHKEEPLTDSLNLKIDKLKDISQIHYVGAKDEIVPPKMTYDILGKDNASVVVVKGATHQKGFDKIYKDIWKER
ncbi:MAG: alpha/beta fold hydrolase [Alphaproteobacteria bacterium]